MERSTLPGTYSKAHQQSCLSIRLNSSSIVFLRVAPATVGYIHSLESASTILFKHSSKFFFHCVPPRGSCPGWVHPLHLTSFQTFDAASPAECTPGSWLRGLHSLESGWERSRAPAGLFPLGRPVSSTRRSRPVLETTFSVAHSDSLRKTGPTRTTTGMADRREIFQG